VESNARPLVVSLLSDYGMADGFVGALHSVLRARLPDVPIVDLTHEIKPQDVRAGALALARAAPYLAAGVVVAVVDPGVGTARRGVALQAGAADVVFVGPDNGLLLPALDLLGGAVLAVELEDAAYQLPSPGPPLSALPSSGSLARGPTFAGRDIFAPAAAHLAAGGVLGALGREVSTGTLVRLPVPVFRQAPDGALEVEVTWVDRYGNVQLAAPAPALAGLAGSGGRLEVTTGPAPAESTSPPWLARVVHTFADLTAGELGALVDSYGFVALSLYGASAAQFLDVREEDVLILRRGASSGL
jgi:S-adenosyl-L-methionine hydrolase (adenosine-forming)